MYRVPIRPAPRHVRSVATTFVVLAAILQIVPATTHAAESQDPQDSLRRELAAQYARRDEGLVKLDPRPYLDALAPGFTHTYVQGPPMKRAAWEQQLRIRLEDLKAQAKRAKAMGAEWKNPEKVSTVILSITITGGTVTASTITTTSTSARYPQGVAFSGSFEDASDDTWIKTALGWRLLAIRQIRSRTISEERRVPAEKPKTDVGSAKPAG